MLGVVSCEQWGGASFLDSVNPNLVASVQSNSIATPYVLRVQLSDVDILHNDVLSTHDTKTFAFDDT